MKKAIFIDAENKYIETVDIKDLEDMQGYVKGNIELAINFREQDDLYVNEEGLGVFEYGFTFDYQGTEHIYYGNGLIVGYDSKTAYSQDARSTIEAIQNRVKFINFKQGD